MGNVGEIVARWGLANQSLTTGDYQYAGSNYLDFDNLSLTSSPIPEPSSYTALVVGVVGRACCAGESGKRRGVERTGAFSFLRTKPLASLASNEVFERLSLADHPPRVAVGEVFRRRFRRADLSIHECDAIFAAVKEIVSQHPEVLSGESVFAGTRVPVRSLFDHLEAGESIDQFLEGFPSVRREQIVALLRAAREHSLAAT